MQESPERATPRLPPCAQGVKWDTLVFIMRLGVIWEPHATGGNYRAIFPMRAMERLGHEVVWPAGADGAPDAARLTSCDVVHVQRRFDERTTRLMGDLARAGIGITWDNDDDFTCAPKEHPGYRVVGGKAGMALFERTVSIARIAHGVSAASRALADRYEQAGIAGVEVIPNLLASNAVRRPRRHDGIVVGWVAGLEHLADVARIPIADALRGLLAEHREVRVECIGVDLGLGERYRHDARLDFEHLPDRIAAFDIGIAPLADIPFNRARSDIKVKEYAACGAAWLASPVGPYVGLGEREGGRLVQDDAWRAELERLVLHGRDRRRLARRARSWAKTQTIDHGARRWEEHFMRAARIARGAARPEAGVA
jgi:hypothetical protein